MLSLKQIQVIPVWKGEKNNILPKNICLSENMIFLTFLAKNWHDFSHNLNAFNIENSTVVKKNPRKQIVAAALHCEFWYLK